VIATRQQVALRALTQAGGIWSGKQYGYDSWRLGAK